MTCMHRSYIRLAGSCTAKSVYDIFQFIISHSSQNMCPTHFLWILQFAFHDYPAFFRSNPPGQEGSCSPSSLLSRRPMLNIVRIHNYNYPLGKLNDKLHSPRREKEKRLARMSPLTYCSYILLHALLFSRKRIPREKLAKIKAVKSCWRQPSVRGEKKKNSFYRLARVKQDYETEKIPWMINLTKATSTEKLNTSSDIFSSIHILFMKQVLPSLQKWLTNNTIRKHFFQFLLADI